MTVIVGVRQVRITNRELEELQRATQLEGTMKVFDVLRSARFTEAVKFVVSELSSRLEDPEFRREAELVSGIGNETHKERYILLTLEEVGTYIKHGLLDEGPILDLYGAMATGLWKRLAELVAAHRRAYEGDELWENFEYLVGRAEHYEGKHLPTVPR